MDVVVDAWAWLPKSELTTEQIVNLKDRLTVVPIKTSEEQKEDPEPIPLYEDTGEYLGIPRQFFFDHQRPVHNPVISTTRGSDDWWPAEFVGTLRAEQKVALDYVTSKLQGGQLGGIIQAKPGWGKTVVALAIAAELGVPTLVVVHKEFLMDQWRQRIAEFLPAAKVGHIQQDVCNFRGNTIVMGMVHSLGSNQSYPDDLWTWPGLIIVDETHRIGARTWAPVPPRFHAHWRLGFTATPRRKDGADDVFWQHLGPVLMAAKEERLKPKIKRVWSKFKLAKTDRFNPNLAPRSLLLKFLCASRHRNDLIVDQVTRALEADRKCIVLSERLVHLERIELLLQKRWSSWSGGAPSIGWYVGGRTKHQLEEAATKRVVLATVQYAAEGLDIPALDTLFLTTPMSDVEQAVGRILRPYQGKKEPIVVDFRDDSIPMFEAMGRKRDRQYSRIA